MHHSFSFPHLITFCMRLMFNHVRVGKEWAGQVFPHPLTSNLRFYAYSWQGKVGWVFPQPICTTVFPHLITFCTRLMLNLVRVGKEWACSVFPHPLTSNFRFYVYSWQGMVGWVFPHPINHMHNSFSPPDNLLHKVDVKPCQGGERMGWPSFSPPPEKQRLHRRIDKMRICVFHPNLNVKNPITLRIVRIMCPVSKHFCFVYISSSPEPKAHKLSL